MKKQTQKGKPDPYDDDSVGLGTSETQGVNRSAEKAPEPNEPDRSPHSSPRAARESTEQNETGESLTSVEPESKRYPTRERRATNYLNDLVTENYDSDAVHIMVDYCCRAVFGIPHMYGEAIESEKPWMRKSSP